MTAHEDELAAELTGFSGVKTPGRTTTVVVVKNGVRQTSVQGTEPADGGPVEMLLALADTYTLDTGDLLQLACHDADGNPHTLDYHA